MRSWTEIFLTALLIFSAFLTAGCFTSGEGAQRKTEGASPCSCKEAIETDLRRFDKGKVERSGGTVSIRIDSEPGLLLSMYSAHPAVVKIIDHDVLEALVNLDSKTGEPIPELAEYWESNATHTSYTFHLVKNARWHDGKPFVADDVVYTFKQLLDPAGGAVTRSRFEDVANVVAVEKYKVVFELDNPRPHFVTDISRIMILPKHILKNTIVVSNAVARAPIGTGPFVFSSWKPGQYIEIARNTQWRKALVPLNKVFYKIVPERRVAVELFNGGSLDIVTDAQGATAQDAHTIDVPLQQFNAWVYNTRNPFFRDVQTRRAISKLFDREAISCSILSCLATPVSSPWPEVVVENSANQFAPKEARALLKKAGWKDSDGNGILDKNGKPFSFTLLLPDTDVTQTRAVTVIVHDLRKAGIEVNLTVVSWAVYTDRLRQHRFDASILTVSTAPPFDAAGLFHTRGITTGRNFGQFSDPKIDAQFERLKREHDAVQQLKIKKSIAKRLAYLQPLSFTFHPFQRHLVRKGIHGLRIGLTGIEERFLWLENPGGQP